MKPKVVQTASPLAIIEADLGSLLRDGKPIRREFGDGNRLHIDRPLPFLCVHVGSHQDAAFQVVSANASYLIAADIGFAGEVARLVARKMRGRCGAFLVLDIGELAEDRFLTEDVPFLPPFEIALSSGDTAAEKAALRRFAAAASGREAKYRTPRVDESNLGTAEARLLDGLGDVAGLTVRFAPIYRVPGTERVYPELRELVAANMVDSALQAISAFLKASKLEQPATHRSLGRRAYIDAVVRADRAIDSVASTFDFLLAVTPINAEPAWREFQAGGFEHVPALLYRPLEFEVAVQKRKLYSVSLEYLEDPLLTKLLSQKQQELDLQLSMLAARETPSFLDLGRALYGSVEPSLAARARTILEKTPSVVVSAVRQKWLGADAVATAARDMIAGYRAAYPSFDASVEIRGDLPAGLLVSRNLLLVSRDTHLPPERLTALLSHEIGVHLLTYFNGDAQGLAMFRNGLAGYEGMQEGLAVLAEYLVGGMTAARLRLIAARVIACQAMLDAATFEEAFRILQRDFGLDDRGAFNVVLRAFRGGGLAKDAIYLRGLGQILDHLKNGGSLTPFWMGKISAAHFGAIQELNARGLLRAPRLEPAFLSSDAARPRLKKAMAGIDPIDMVET